MHAPGDVRVEDREVPTIVEPTDAIIRLTASCICGSDLWPYRGAEPVEDQPMGHEYVGVVDRDRRRRHDRQGRRLRRRLVLRLRQHLRDLPGGLPDALRAPAARRRHRRPVRVRPRPARRRHPGRHPRAAGRRTSIPSLLAASDVLGTGWFAAVAAEVGPGKTVAVVGDGAVGLLGILAARELGAERIIAMSRHADRQALARHYGATDVVEERGEAGVARIKELTDGLGAHSTIEAVGTQESMTQAIQATRAGGHVGYVGVSHDVSLDGLELFFSGVHLHGGPAPVRRFLPDLIQRIWDREIDPGKVFDLTLPLEDAAEGYRAMDERRATKVLLTH